MTIRLAFMRHIIWTAAIVLVARFAVAADSSVEPNRPARFRTSIGGFLGSTYSVELVGDALQYRVQTHGRETAAETIRPTAEQWSDFRDALDDIGAWRWQPSYFNPVVADGTQWSIDIAYPDRALKCSGSNAYPRADGTSNNAPSTTPEFAQYLNAVTELIDGKRFR